jgi:hypothetical protein
MNGMRKNIFNFLRTAGLLFFIICRQGMLLFSVVKRFGIN